jgi:hypothetical protein
VKKKKKKSDTKTLQLSAVGFFFADHRSQTESRAILRLVISFSYILLKILMKINTAKDVALSSPLRSPKISTVPESPLGVFLFILLFIDFNNHLHGNECIFNSIVEAQTNPNDTVAMLAFRQAIDFPSSNWNSTDDPCGMSPYGQLGLCSIIKFHSIPFNQRGLVSPVK